MPKNLEAVCIEIIKPQSQPFVVVTAYRPPNPSSEFFTDLKSLIKKIDDENKEIHILGDLNCDLLKPNPDQLTKKLKSIYELYDQLSQMIDEATRITSSTSTLIDHFITNRPEKISDSGVIHTGISDHSMIFAIRKIHFSVKRHVNIVEIRNMKKFNDLKFLKDLQNQPWDHIYYFPDNPNTMWEMWKKVFLEVLDKHAPLQNKKIKSKSVPWFTSKIKMLITERDKLKRKAIITKQESDWLIYKKARNQTNTELRKAKTDYYSKKIANQRCNPKQAWKTINSLIGKGKKPTIINELIINESKLTNPTEIAEGLNEFFANVGPNLASKLDESSCDFQKYTKSSESEFTAFTPIAVNKIFDLLRGLSCNKACGVDKISSKILKLA